MATQIEKVINISKRVLSGTYKGTKYLLTNSPSEMWKRDIRPKIPIGSPDVSFDLKEHESTKKNYGISFAPTTKKKGHEKDVTIDVPRYELPYESMKKFEAWLESSEDDKKNENFTPQSSDNKKLSKNEEEAYKRLIDVNNFLKEKGGSIKGVPVKLGSLKNQIVIEIDTSNKTLKQIENEIAGCFDKLGLPRDSRMISTAAKRLYDGANNQAISSDKPLPAQKPPIAPQSKTELDNNEVIEENSEYLDSESNSKLNKKSCSKKVIKESSKHLDAGSKSNNQFLNKENKKSSSNKTEPEAQIDDVPDSQFSKTDPQKFPSNIQKMEEIEKKPPNEQQGELVSKHLSLNQQPSINNDIKDRATVIGKGLDDVSLGSENKIKQLHPSAVNGRNNDTIRGA